MPKDLIDLTGKKFGRLTVLHRSGSDRHGNALWSCRCACGQERVFNGLLLRRGDTRSCGCFMRDINRVIHWRHGRARRRHLRAETPEYAIWVNARDRCLNRHDRDFRFYGGRGISFSRVWARDFHQFLRDVGRRPGAGCRLERIDRKGNFQAGNVRWVQRRVRAGVS